MEPDEAAVPWAGARAAPLVLGSSPDSPEQALRARSPRARAVMSHIFFMKHLGSGFGALYQS